MTENTDPIGENRRKLLGIAYRMLGSMTDAEDVLQDAWLRFQSADKKDIRSEEGYLVTIVTRLCLDRLKSAKAKREVYIGPWLPEPVMDVDAISPDKAVELADDLSFALLLTLDRLSGPERAAFLLHDVFDTPFADIAAMLGKSEGACRQLAARARKAVRKQRPVKSESEDRQQEHTVLLERFMAAVATGDTDELSALLAEDVVAYSDGGGVKNAALNPIKGADKVMRFFTGLMRKSMRLGLKAEFYPTEINGTPGLIAFVDDELDQTISIAVRNHRIAALYMVRNPHKLAGLSVDKAAVN